MSMYALTRKEGFKAKVHISCFYDVILLFKIVQRWAGCLKITKFERLHFVNGPLLA